MKTPIDAAVDRLGAAAVACDAETFRAVAADLRAMVNECRDDPNAAVLLEQIDLLERYVGFKAIGDEASARSCLEAAVRIGHRVMP